MECKKCGEPVMLFGQNATCQNISCGEYGVWYERNCDIIKEVPEFKRCL